MRRMFLALAALGAGFIGGSAGAGTGEMEPAAIRQAEKRAVHSADGTRIAFTEIGSGPVPVVIVHGALNSGEHWMPVAAALAEHCTCYVIDRWGRGGSGHHTDYALEREAEDIKAVLAVAGPDAYLLGHSSGAIYSLEAAQGSRIAGLVLYEPPLHAGAAFESTVDRIRLAEKEQRLDDAVSIFLREEARIPEVELSSLKATPVWADMVALAPQSVREWEELVEDMPTVERYRDVAVPTLLLSGTETTDHPSFATEALQGTLPDARIARLAGQGHGGHLGAPDMVAREVIKFILEASQ